MSDDFLSRWSRRKLAARAGREVPPAPVIPVEAESPSVAPSDAPRAAGEVAPLPPLESLTPESDFAPFMQAQVDPATRRQALKTLFSDPQFNVMDGLDVYIDDYSKPDPLPEGWLAKMNQVARLGDYLGSREGEAPPGEGVPPAASTTPSLNPEAVAVVQPEEEDGKSDSSSAIEGMPTAKG